MADPTTPVRPVRVALSPTTPESVAIEVVLEGDEGEISSPHPLLIDAIDLDSKARTAGTGLAPAAPEALPTVPTLTQNRTPAEVELGCFAASKETLRTRTFASRKAASGLTATIQDLPHDALRLVFEFLSPKELASLGATGKSMADLALGDDQSWRVLLSRDFHAPPPPWQHSIAQRPMLSRPSSSPSPSRSTSPSSSPSRSVVLAALNGPTSPNNTAGGRATPASPARSSTAAAPGVAAGAVAGAVAGSPRPSKLIDHLLLTSFRSERQQAQHNLLQYQLHPLKNYLRLSLEHREDSAKRLRKKRRTEGELHAMKRQFRLRIFLDVVHWGCGLGVYPWLLFAWLLLLLLRTNNTAPDLSWIAVWTPLMLAIIWPVLFAAVGALTEVFARRAQRRYRQVQERSSYSGDDMPPEIEVTTAGCCYRQDEGDDYSFVQYAQKVKAYESGRCIEKTRTRCCCFSLPFFSLLMAPLLIMLKLENVGLVGQATWATTLIPVWIFFLTWCCMPCAGYFPCTDERDGGEDRNTLAMTQACGTLVFAPVIAVTAAILDGAPIRLVFALLPLFILDVLLVGLLIFFLLMSCLSSSHSDRKEACVASLGVIILLSFGLGAQVPAVVYWENGSGSEKVAAALLIPAVVFMGLVSIGWSTLSAALLRRARRPSDGHFSAVYRVKWRTIEDGVKQAMPQGHASTEGLAAALRALKR